MLGGFAEVAVSPEFLTFPLPDELDFRQGAALILNYHTAWFSLVIRGPADGGGDGARPRRRRRASGPRRSRSPRASARRSIAVVSTDEKEQVAREAGADEVVRSDGEWRDEAKELSGGGVDLVLDPVGGDRFTDSLRSLAEGGRLVVVGFTAGLDPRGQGQPAAAQQHRGDRRGLGRLRDRQAGAEPRDRSRDREADRLRARAAARRRRRSRSASTGAAEALKLIDGRGATGKVVLDVALMAGLASSSSPAPRAASARRRPAASPREPGAELVLVARREERLRELAAALPAPATWVAADLTEPDAPGRVAAHVEERHGRLDLLVNNAGASWRGDASPTRAGRTSERTMELNFDAVVRLTEALLPILRALGAERDRQRRQHRRPHLPGRRRRLLGEQVRARRLERLALLRGAARTGVHVGLVLPGFIATEGFPAAELRAKALDPLDRLDSREGGRGDLRRRPPAARPSATSRGPTGWSRSSASSPRAWSAGSSPAAREGDDDGDEARQRVAGPRAPRVSNGGRLAPRGGLGEDGRAVDRAVRTRRCSARARAGLARGRGPRRRS